MNVTMYNYPFCLHSEVLGNKPQSVLLAYLRVVLMEWEEPQEALERANMILSIIHNRQHVQELLASLLSSKVNTACSSMRVQWKCLGAML